jgi:CYTH domain-containing protein
VPIEIERKFLLRGIPDDRDLLSCRAEALEIEQWYLKVADGFEERIRRTSTNQETFYHHTYLMSQSAGVREVQERTIDRDEYDLLRSAGDPCRVQVVKRRLRFVFESQVFELDIIRSPPSRSCFILELQIESEDQEIALPHFVRIAREVTGERAYTNADIALG